MSTETMPTTTYDQIPQGGQPIIDAEIVPNPADVILASSPDALQQAFDAPSVAEPVYPQPLTPNTSGSSAPETSAPATSAETTTATVPGPGAETNRQLSRPARLGRIALRMTGITAAAQYTRETVDAIKGSVYELRADNQTYKAQKMAVKADKAMVKKRNAEQVEAQPLNQADTLNKKAATLREQADNASNSLKREFTKGRAEFAEMRAEKKQRVGQKLAAKVLAAEKQRVMFEENQKAYLANAAELTEKSKKKK